MLRNHWVLLTALLPALACTDDPTAAPDPQHPPLAPAVAAGRQPAWRVVELGTADMPGSIALGINDRGTVVGYCQRAEAPGREQACVWRRPGTLPPEFLVGGGPGSQATDVNAAGDIVGVVSRSDGLHAVVWPVIGGLVDLGRTRNTTFPSINANGDVVWGVPDPAGDGKGPTRVSLLRDGAILDLGVAVPNLGNGYGEPAGISDDGVIAVTGGTYWKRNRWLPLVRPEGVTGDLIPWRVTPDGDIVGQLAGGTPVHLGLWWPTPKRVRTLGVDFVPYDRGRGGLIIGEGHVTLDGGQEWTVAATWTQQRSTQPLPSPQGFDPRGRAIRINRVGWIVGFTVRPSAVGFGQLDNCATLWIPR